MLNTIKPSLNLLLLLTLTASGFCRANYTGYLNPLSTPVLKPTTLIFGLPDLQTRLLAPEHSFEISFQSHFANTFINRESGDEALLIDGEVQSFSLQARWKLTDTWEMAVSLPYISHSKGTLDNLIYDWHEWFGLPQGGRAQDTNNQFAYIYTRDGSTLLDLQEKQSEIGDVHFLFYHQARWLEQDWVAQVDVKAPTGDAEALTGSGAWDLSLGLGWQRELDSSLGKFSHFAGVGLSYLGSSDIGLSPLQEHWALTGRAGFHWHALSWLSLTGQIDTNTPLYDSELKSLGATPLQLSVGARFFISDRLRLDASFGEDLNTLASPDFVASVGAGLLW